MIATGILLAFLVESKADVALSAPDAFSGQKPQMVLRDELLHLRDPFQMPNLLSGTASLKSELENYASDSFKLVGILTGLDRIRALVLAPDGKSFFVTERMRIGLHEGFIQKIRSDRLIIREKVTNPVGQVSFVDTDLRISGGADGNKTLLSTITRPPGSDKEDSDLLGAASDQSHHQSQASDSSSQSLGDRPAASSNNNNLLQGALDALPYLKDSVSGQNTAKAIEKLDL